MENQISFTLEHILTLDKEYRRNLINCLSGFKSVCLCGTADKKGNTNLSLISSVIHVGANPPLMGMLMRPHTVRRDTIENINEVGFFTLNHLHKEILDRAHQASARYPKEVSEFEAVGLHTQKSQRHNAPYVEEAYLKIGLAVEEKIVLKSNKTLLIVGKIVELLIPEHIILADGFIDLEVIGTLTVSGLDSYHETKSIRRLPYAKAPS